jgi:hypothetical protein
MADQRYDEQQIGAILQRAAEIQSGLAPEGEVQGLTLGELQKVASEVGIEPHIVERAAQEVARPSTAKSLAGTLDQTVPGEITEEQWEDAVMELRQFVGRPGTSTMQGSTREWTGGWDIGHVTLTASTRNRQTRFRMMLDTSGFGVLAWLIGGTVGFLALMFAIVIAKKTSIGLPEALAGLAVIEALLGFTVFHGLKRSRKRMDRQVSEIFQSIVANVSNEEPALQQTAEPAQERDVQRLAIE